MYASQVTSIVVLEDEISVIAGVAETVKGNILIIDGCFTFYGSDSSLRKIAQTITDHLNQKEEKESVISECTTYQQQQAG